MSPKVFYIPKSYQRYATFSRLHVGGETKKMRKQFTIATVAILLLSVLIVPTAISASENGHTYFRFTGTTELWHESHDGADWTYAFPVGDLDGDGGEDVLVLTSTYNETANTETKTVIAKRGYDGKYLWSVYVTGTEPSLSANAAGDLDGDGKADVLVHSATAETVIAKRGYDGEQLWEESVTGTGSSLSAKAAGDLDGDGRADVLVYFNKYDKFSDKTKGTVIAKRGYDGEHLWEESVTGGTGGSQMILVGNIASASIAGDLNGDGKEDILVQLSEYNEDTGEITAKVIAKRGYDGEQLWGLHATKTGASLSAKAAGDLVGDGRGDVLLKVSTIEFDFTRFPPASGSASVIAVQGYDGKQLWEESVTGTWEFDISADRAGDLDGDGKEDVLVYDATTETVIAKRGYDGKHLWAESVTETGSSLLASAAGDLDGDGKGDVLVCTYEDDYATDTTTATVIAKRGYDGEHLWEESVTGADIFAQSAGDLDGDGKGDVLVRTAEYDSATDTRSEKVIAKRGYDGTHLWTAESDGSIWVTGPLWGPVPWDLLELIGSGQMGRPADLNGDGIANILLGPWDEVYAV